MTHYVIQYFIGEKYIPIDVNKKIQKKIYEKKRENTTEK